MSRIKNICTGETYMTDGNALRHYVVKARKALKSEDYNMMKQVWKNACETLNPDLCACCCEDDIGYCGLRKSNISEEEKFVNYCFPSFLKAMEKEVKF